MRTADWVGEEIKRSYERASEAGQKAAASEPRARSARYDARNNRIVVELSNGCVFAFPPQLAQGLGHADPKQLASVKTTPRGGGLHWETLNVDLSVPNLMLGIFGTKAWMRELGRRGGSAISKVKVRAARENGKKGGRPAKAKKPASA
jgi:Protein of unknown function (DUF2442)